jgi:hypothetical protein
MYVSVEELLSKLKMHKVVHGLYFFVLMLTCCLIWKLESIK